MIGHTSHGVLTHAALRELADAEHWHVVLRRAVESGRVRQLDSHFYEAGPETR